MLESVVLVPISVCFLTLELRRCRFRHFLDVIVLFSASYCFLPILKFYPVEQICVQFIFRSIIGIEALRSKF